MSGLPMEYLLPHRTVIDVRRRVDSRPRGGSPEVRMRLRGDVLIARRWVPGYAATGHSVLRARLHDVPDGVLVRGLITASGLDIVLIAIWFVAALALLALGVVLQSWPAMAIALVPLAFGVAFTAGLPRAVRDGRDVILRDLNADLG